MASASCCRREPASPGWRKVVTALFHLLCRSRGCRVAEGRRVGFFFGIALQRLRIHLHPDCEWRGRCMGSGKAGRRPGRRLTGAGRTRIVGCRISGACLSSCLGATGRHVATPAHRPPGLSSRVGYSRGKTLPRAGGLGPPSPLDRPMVTPPRNETANRQTALVEVYNRA